MVTGYQARNFAEISQVSPIHSMLTILQVKEMASSLVQLKGNCLDQVSLLHLVDEQKHELSYYL